MGLRESLGFTSSDAAWESVSDHLKRFYINNEDEQSRRKAASLRAELYRDGGIDKLKQIIRLVFGDAQVRHVREVWAQWARFDNALRRIVNELSTVYSDPAVRRVEDELSDERYQDLQRVTRLDALMRRANRWLNLHNDVLVWFRVRENLRGEREPIVDVLAPHAFYAVSDPMDPTRLIAIIIDQTPQTMNVSPADPHFVVWTDEESLKLDKSGRVLVETVEPNKFGRMPGMLLHRDPPEMALLDSKTGDDLVNAHLSASFVNVLLLKEARTVNRQVAFGGDLSTTATGQAQDTGADLMLGDGVTVQTVDRSVDLRQYRETADHIIERAASNHGIPPSILRHEGAASALEIELRRIGLRERRNEQILVFRPAERTFAEIMSLVVASDDPAHAFRTDGWSIDFGQVELPRDPMTKLNFREKQRRLGLANTLEFIMEDNPDLDVEQALRKLELNIDIEVKRNELMRPLMEMNGSASQGVDDARTPEENGESGPDEGDDA